MAVRKGSALDYHIGVAHKEPDDDEEEERVATTPGVPARQTTTRRRVRVDAGNCGVNTPPRVIDRDISVAVRAAVTI